LKGSSRPRNPFEDSQMQASIFLLNLYCIINKEIVFQALESQVTAFLLNLYQIINQGIDFQALESQV